MSFKFSMVDPLAFIIGFYARVCHKMALYTIWLKVCGHSYKFLGSRAQNQVHEDLVWCVRTQIANTTEINPIENGYN